MKTSREDFAHALLERRLADGFADIEYLDTHPFGNNTANMIEPLHDQTAPRIIEAVENLAKRILCAAKRQRSKIIATHLTFSQVDLRITVFEFKGIE